MSISDWAALCLLLGVCALTGDYDFTETQVLLISMSLCV